MKTSTLKDFAKSCTTPMHFIKGVMGVQDLAPKTVAKKAGITVDHFYVIMDNLRKGHSLGMRTIARLAIGLDIDPFILNWVVAKYSMEKCLRKMQELQDN